MLLEILSKNHFLNSLTYTIENSVKDCLSIISFILNSFMEALILSFWIQFCKEDVLNIFVLQWHLFFY